MTADPEQFTLYVSEDCGIHYHLHCQSPSMQGLGEACDELDEKGLRWYIEDSHGRMRDRISKTHLQILMADMGDLAKEKP